MEHDSNHLTHVWISSKDSKDKLGWWDPNRPNNSKCFKDFMMMSCLLVVIVGMWIAYITLFTWYFLMKWQSISMGLILSSKIKLEAKWIAAQLSQFRIVGESHHTCKCSSNLCNHMTLWCDPFLCTLLNLRTLASLPTTT